MSAGSLNITVEQGSTFQYPVQIMEADGVTPVDLTGYTFGGMIRLNYNDATPLATFTINETDLVNGSFAFELTSATTTALSFKRAMYDIEITSPTSVTSRVLEGFVRLSKEVTK